MNKILFSAIAIIAALFLNACSFFEGGYVGEYFGGDECGNYEPYSIPVDDGVYTKTDDAGKTVTIDRTTNKMYVQYQLAGKTIVEEWNLLE